MSYTKTILGYENDNYDLITTQLCQIDCDQKLDIINNINVCSEIINNILNHIINTYIPQKRIRVRSNDKPWVNKDKRQAIRKGNRCHKKLN